MLISLPKKKKKISLISNTFTIKKKVIILTSILKQKQKAKKQVLVLAIFMSVIASNKKTIQNIWTTETSKDGENNKNDKYLRTNLE